jgi:signal transduction histidine kinase
VKTRKGVFAEMQDRLHRETDRLFLWLLLGQWVFAIGLAVVIAPFSDEGGERSVHPHVVAAIVVGGLINALPIALVITRPGWWGTRHTLTVVQMLWSALLITITNGRIETHFHVIGSLAFLAFYRDWKVVPTATAVVAIDHVVRGIWWPDSVYGVANPEWWRFLEHAAWVAFADVIVVLACLRGVRELRAAAGRESRLERTNSIVEHHVRQRTTQLHDTMEYYRDLVEHSELVTFEYDYAARRIRHLAPQASKLLDCPLGELHELDFLPGAIHPEDKARVSCELDAMATGQRSGADPIDCRLVTKRGRIVYVRTFLDARPGSRRIRAFMLDMTRQRQLENELQQAQKLESVGRLAAGVAHEINTPIQFIGDSVQFMAQAITDVMDVIAKQQKVVDAILVGTPVADLAAEVADAREASAEADLEYMFVQIPKAAERALDGVHRVGTIVRSMNVFAHPDKVDMAPVDLNQAITSTLTIARNEYRYVANVDTELGQLPPVTCYAGEINQVILNILINSAHAIGEIHAQTGTRGKITVKTAVDVAHVLISIRDTGGGIPDEVGGRIFDPFFTTKGVGKGTGQGLSIARSVIIDRHHGEITFQSTPGVGTTFNIRIPIDPVQPARKAAA